MSHHRRAVGLAVGLNTAIFLGEALAGASSHSLSLVMDSVHNFSDELALIFLYVAFRLPGRLARHSQRTANLLNSGGLTVISLVLAGQALGRLAQPQAVQAWTPVVAGLAAAAANWGVAALLRDAAHRHAAVRLAYLHNRGDILVSLVPVAAGLIVAATGYPRADALLALALAVWLIVTTAQEVRASGLELLWPQELRCEHAPEVSDGRSG